MIEFNQIKAVAFDLDGTLVDSAPGLAQAMDSALYALELPQAGEARVKNWIGNGADVLVQRAVDWAVREKKAQDEQKAANTGLPVVVHPTVPESERAMMLRKLFDRYYAECAASGSSLFPAVAETLAALKQTGLQLGLVTNKPTPFVRPLLESLHIDHYFDVVIGGDDVQHKKPHPEALLRLLAQFGRQAGEMLFVGDSRNDILAAQAASCPAVGLSYGYNYGEAISQSNPDMVLDSFSDLLPAFGLPVNEHQE
ncbi:phosphoglycolate phosphatase [Shimwellia blattae]|uniref:Phosphoglycolate phosphatase n=1 Tax=Shimwellia blattae (strain ATCC 29907 / DSM 4481 / JCM 1650 / NBRC 105725 / CDC 9005-74) TaxID=630626 RepID=I2B4C6_SHIBC|nr:phosphoglycolate phosphatase [Shimwellia blattae]AFJ45380.1 phosphoglycolate phosphatase [Shimwellia blattae DSM 4481 = NBRC 105725]GAB82867.1 phosphoglycolate phosphatase [Shimwellia blattae DSM 4481 = NBRC 105725]VDY62862.1 Phosphoglycolate phosphatase [Shimwellia blattae]VEC19778.1 Phosphoglycolate phosphatase [Shimwellia blattae]